MIIDIQAAKGGGGNVCEGLEGGVCVCLSRLLRSCVMLLR